MAKKIEEVKRKVEHRLKKNPAERERWIERKKLSRGKQKYNERTGEWEH